MTIDKKQALSFLMRVARTDEEFDMIEKIRKGEADITDYIVKFPCPPSFMGFLTSPFVYFPKREKEEWLGY